MAGLGWPGLQRVHLKRKYHTCLRWTQAVIVDGVDGVPCRKIQFVVSSQWNFTVASLHPVTQSLKLILTTFDCLCRLYKSSLILHCLTELNTSEQRLFESCHPGGLWPFQHSVDWWHPKHPPPCHWVGIRIVYCLWFKEGWNGCRNTEIVTWSFSLLVLRFGLSRRLMLGARVCLHQPDVAVRSVCFPDCAESTAHVSLVCLFALSGVGYTLPPL